MSVWFLFDQRLMRLRKKFLLTFDVNEKQTEHIGYKWPMQFQEVINPVVLPVWGLLLLAVVLHCLQLYSI
ncbi:MAG: hypothetical protein HRU20_20955 [Pseudomonadales bacterium]|nr:hypothetical protein [Pseudomonadales bacterium]